MAFRTAEQVAADVRAALPAKVAEAETVHDARLSDATKVVSGVLVSPPEARFPSGGGKLIGFLVREPGRDRPMSGVMSVADHESRVGFAREAFDDRMAEMKAGDEVSLAGRWSKRKWRDAGGAERESWEFRTSFAGRGAGRSVDDLAAEAARPIADARASLGGGASVDDRPAASPSVSYASGNIVDDQAQVLVNTVNCRLSSAGNGVMGKGVAKAFKERFPSIMPEYEEAIRSGALTPGRTLLFDLPDGRVWAAMATKDYAMRNGVSMPSEMAWVESGLKELGEKMREAGLTSVALPPPGCGNGGLDWKAVEPIVHRELGDMDVSLYARPSGSMAPVAARDGVGAAAAPAERAVDEVKARQLAAMGGGRGSDASSALWTKERLLAAIPDLFSAAGGYKAYAGIGARETPVAVADEMTAAARAFEKRGLILRSGGADKAKGVQPPGTKSADISFEEGVSDRRMKEIFIPWKGFGVTPDGIVLSREREIEARRIAEAAHPGWEHCSDGAKRMHTRNVPQIRGADLDRPVAFALCWTKNGAFAHEGPNGTNKDDGGTGQAIRIASRSGIPVLNMRDPDIRAAVLRELGIAQERAIERGVQAPQAVKERSASEFDLSIPPTRSRAKRDIEFFCKVSDPHGIQSNMATTPLKVGDLVYRGSENLYQALRFPDHPELQARIAAETPYGCKMVARENDHLTRPDWISGGVNIAAMAYAITVKHDQVKAFRDDLASTEGRDMVELSTRDPFWGAQARGDQLVGQDVLGGLLTQLRGGARMEEPPQGSKLPGLGMGGAPSRAADQVRDLPDPSIRASMYFSYGASRRPGFESATTFDAILAGERTSTTRYPEWGPLDRYEKLRPGDVARFYEDKEMKGRHVDVVVTGVNRIDLRTASPERLEEWSRVEGWSVQHARDSGRKHAEGVQIRYALPGSPEADAALAERSERSGRDAPGPAVPDRAASQPPRRAMAAPVQHAALSAKNRALSLF